MSLPICTYGNPVLRQKAVEVMNVDAEIHELVKDMFETMYAEKGVGLAAEQVGRTERIFIVDIPADSDVGDDGRRENPAVEMPLVFINPKITGHTEEIQVGPEGCLSFPDIFANVERWYEVDAEYIDRDGLPRTIHAKGLLARAIQHELDHLDGVLLVDRMSHVKKVAIGGKLKRLVKETKKAL
ncbi:Peptide deformylase 2 [Pontiella desulfatans]|uniref:Peptide deformylase n=1 Tax=Pontiella desulfatans TaxID=2750659 RepID=A0A6C2UB06_PONDE|nr:peptide deformylase [Pontiella desulfatans]VGO17043.1 Peptide deformylase 2 [Pontiella desulfatans]